MKLDFLKDFDKRMKKVGAYTLINYNSFFKSTLKNFGFDVPAESSNIIYAMMLYIMEQSLKEESCTLDDIASFIEEIDKQYFKKRLDYGQCKTIADFAVNTVLCNNGEAMYFKGYNFDKSDYEDINISLINNEIVYVDDVRRTSYYLTEDGYYLMLGTLEVESNLKLTVQELIFKLHLEKADYDKAIEDVKQLFNLSRIQLQKIEESIRKIRENVFGFSPQEYDGILNDNMGIIDRQKKNFKGYRDYVLEREKDLIEDSIDIGHLNEDDEKALQNLGIIKKQLSKVIDEHQRILNSHFDFKRVYSDALMDMTAFSAIKRISLTRDLYEPILKNLSRLDALPKILRPLYLNKLPQNYNIGKCIEPQRVIREKDLEEEAEIFFDGASLREERERELRLKLLKYKGILEILLNYLVDAEVHAVSLEEILEDMKEHEEKRDLFIPEIEIFREVMIELLKANTIVVEELLTEAEKDIEGRQINEFELNSTIISIISESKRFKNIKAITVQKDFSGKELKIPGARTNDGYVKTVRCSNLLFNIIN